MIDAVALLAEVDTLPPMAKLVVAEYLSQYAVRTGIRNHRILERLDELQGRGITKTQAVDLVADEFGASPSTIWGLIRDC